MINQNKSILITGGTSGIGLVLAQKLADFGHRVHISGSSQDSLKKALQTLPRQIEGHVIDLTTGECPTFAGPLDILIHCAGLSMRAGISEISPTHIQDIMAVNATGPMVLTRNLLPQIKEARGRVVFVSTLGALLGFPNIGVYSSAKASLENFAQALEVEEKGSDVSTAIVYLDFVENDPKKTIVGPGGQKIHHHRKATLTRARAAQIIATLALGKKRRSYSTIRGWFLQALVRHFPRLSGRLLLRKGANLHKSKIKVPPSQ